MDVDIAHERTLRLLGEAPAAYLTTIDQNGWPQTRAMLNLRNEALYPALIPVFAPHTQDLKIFFTTNTSSGKISQIIHNTKSSVYYCNPSGWQGLMLGGEISVVSDARIKKEIWQKEWTMYYPGGVEDPDYAILCLTPNIAKYYEYLDTGVWSPEKDHGPAL